MIDTHCNHVHLAFAYAMSVALVDAIGFIYISFQLHAQNTRKCMQCLTQHENLA